MIFRVKRKRLCPRIARSARTVLNIYRTRVGHGDENFLPAKVKIEFDSFWFFPTTAHRGPKTLTSLRYYVVSREAVVGEGIDRSHS